MSKLKAITKTQEKAFSRVIKSIRAANKVGLVFYGKSENLVAYTKQSDKYVEQYGLEHLLRVHDTSQIENLSECVLRDSGADDFPSYLKNEDDPFYSID